MQKFAAFFSNGLLQISFAAGFVFALIGAMLWMHLSHNIIYVMWVVVGVLFITYSIMRGYLATKSPWYNVMNRIHWSDNRYLLGRDELPELDVTGLVTTMKFILACAWAVLAITALGSVITIDKNEVASHQESLTKPPITAPYYAPADQQHPDDREPATVMEPASALYGTNVGFLRVRSTIRNRTFILPVGMPCDLAPGTNVSVRLIYVLVWMQETRDGKMYDSRKETIPVLDLPLGSACTYNQTGYHREQLTRTCLLNT